MHVALASLLSREPINHGGGFISLVELNASSSSIPSNSPIVQYYIIQYRREEKWKYPSCAPPSYIILPFLDRTALCRTCVSPHHSCGDPNAVVFTLFGGWFHSKFYPLGSTVDLCLYIACLIDHQRLQSGRRNSHRHASTRKSPKSKSKSQSQATPDKSAHIVKSLGCVTHYVARA